MRDGDFSTRVARSDVRGNVTGGVGNTVHTGSSGEAPSANVEEILDALARLRTAIESSAVRVEEAAPALRDIDDIVVEVNEAIPDRHRVRDAFQRLAARLGTAGELLGGVYYAKQLVEAFLA